MRGEFIDIDGARLYYYAAGTRGAGEPLLLVHGFPTSSHLWAGLVRLAPPGHRVVVVDLLGFGRSDRPAGRDVSLRGHAARLVGLLDALKINYACVVGHDIGGGIAQAMALRAPARVSRLCLIDSVAYDGWPPREVRLARAMLPLTRHLPATWLLSILRTDLIRGYADAERGAHSIERYVHPFASPDGREALIAHLGSLDAAETTAMAPRLAEIVVPTAVVWGANDPFLPVALGRRLHEAIAGSTFDIVPDARHFVPEEAPKRLAQLVTALLDR